MLKVKWTERIENDEEERLLLKLSKNRSHSWKGQTIGYNEFVVNLPEGKMAVGRPRLQ